MILFKHLLSTMLAFLVLLVVTPTFAADEIKTTTRIDTDKLVEDNLENQLETRLVRDVEAYLNHSRFVINVDLDVITLRTDTLVPIEKSSSVSSPKINKVTTIETNTTNDTSSVDESRANNANSLLVLPGLPLSGSNTNASQPQQKNRNEVTKTVVENSSESKDSKQEQSYVALSPHLINTIEKMSISVILDDTTSTEDQRFVRDLVIEKSQFNRVRGDEIDVSLSTFVQSEAMAVERKDVLGNLIYAWWFWPFLVAVALLLLIWLLWRLSRTTTKESAAPVSQPSFVGVDAPANHTALDSVVERFVTAVIAHPEGIKSQFEGRMQDEATQSMLAAIYESVPAGVFKAIFPDLTQDQRMSLIEKSATSPLEDTQKFAMLTALMDMLDTKSKDSSAQAQENKLAPFSFLKKLDNNQFIYVINEEPPRIMALAISQLPGERAAVVLSKLPEAISKEVIVALGDIAGFPLDAFRFIAERLARKALDAPSFENIHTDGINILSSVLDAMPEMEAQASLESLKQDAPELYLRIKEVYLTFEDIDRSLLNTLFVSAIFIIPFIALS